MARKHQVVVVCALMCASLVGAWAQDQAAVDLKDPAAVARAYLKACGEGDVEGALALLSPDTPQAADLGELCLQMQEPSAQEQHWDMIVEMGLIPVRLPIGPKLGKVTEKGEEARVAFRGAVSLEGNLVLARQADGTWGVKLVESVRASTKSGESRNLESWWALRDLAEDPAQVNPSLMRLEAIRNVLLEYAEDHDGRLPLAERWVDEIEPYLPEPELLKCPATPNLECGYAMNEDLSGQVLQDDPATEWAVPLLFEWPGGERNAHAKTGDIRSARADGTIVGLTMADQSVALPAGVTPAQAAEAWRAYRGCEAHLKALAQAARRYARAHGGVLPPADGWEEALAPYVTPEPAAAPGTGPLASVLVCPAAPDRKHPYAINTEVAGQKLAEVLDWGVLFFESDLDVPNAAGNPSKDAPREGRHSASLEGPPPEREALFVYVQGYMGSLLPAHLRAGDGEQPAP